MDEPSPADPTALVPEVDGRARTVPKQAAKPDSNNNNNTTNGESESSTSDYSDAKFDEFSGFQENLFGGGAYDEEDKEADLIFDAIDRRMDSRRKKRREELVKKEMEKYREKRPRIQEQFAELKRGLGELSESDWESIPDPLDYSRRNKLLNKENTREKFSAVPDNILAQAALGNKPTAFEASIDQTSIGRARDKVWAYFFILYILL